MRKSMTLTLLLAATTLFALSQQEKPLDPFEEAMKQRQQYLQNFGILPGDLFAAQGEELTS